MVMLHFATISFCNGLRKGLSPTTLTQTRSNQKAFLESLSRCLGGVRCMGGGPRTFPGGVSKWQWKRMLDKKKRERDKIWLSRERGLYERRRRAQIMAMMPVRPWEKLPPSAVSLPAVDRDPKIKEMARRFQTDWGLDLWKDEDGPETCAANSDQKGSKPPGTKGFYPLTLSVSQRVSDLSRNESAKRELRENRAARSLKMEKQDPPEEPQVFEHSGSMLASYLRKQGYRMAELPEEEVKPNANAATVRTEYSTWLEALSNDGERRRRRQLITKGFERTSSHK